MRALPVKSAVGSILLLAATVTFAAPKTKSRLAARAPATQPIAAPAVAGAVMNGPALLAGAQNKVFFLQITAKTGSAATQFFTAFAVQSNGILLTSYHAVSGALANPEEMELKILAPTGALPAEVLAYDVTNDMALLKVNKVFHDVYSVSTTVPRARESLAMVEAREKKGLVLRSAVAREVRKSGPFTRLLFDGDHAEGAAGCPLLNASGQIVGMTDGVRFQYFSAIPAELVRGIVRIGARAGRPIAHAVAAADVQVQVDKILLPWMSNWKTYRDRLPPLKLAGLTIFPPAPGVECRGQGGKASGTNDRVVSCENEDFFQLANRVVAGRMKFDYWEIGDRPGDFTQLRTVSGLKRVAANQFGRAPAWIKDKNAGYSCDHHAVHNLHGISLLAEYCARPTLGASGAYDLVLTVSPLGRSGGLLGEMNLRGFTPAATRLAAELFLDGFAD